MSRIELGTFNLKLSKVNIKEVSRGVIDELRPSIDERKLKVIEKYSGNLNSVEIDHKIIRLILQNLITNAVKYTPSHGSINVDVALQANKKGAGNLIISVADTGVGIPTQDQAKIFSKLFRSDNIKTLDADGNGLGLYIVKSFTEIWGGKIWFKSREGKGTTFFVNLPLKTSHENLVIEA